MKAHLHAGTSHAIAAFYRKIFHARTEMPSEGESVVYIGPGTKFRFTENAALGPVTNKVTGPDSRLHTLKI